MIPSTVNEAGAASECRAACLRVNALILSDIRLVSETLADALGQGSMFAEVFGVASIAEAAARIDAGAPSLVLIDATMRGGLAAARWLLGRDPLSRKIVFNLDEAAQDIAVWTEAGIAEQVGRSATVKDLVQRVAAVIDGGCPGPAPVVVEAQGDVEATASPETADMHAATAMLTPREEEVVQLIIAGESNKEIARVLKISLPTVKSHVHNLLGKLGVERRGKLALQYERRPPGDRDSSSRLIQNIGPDADAAALVRSFEDRMAQGLPVRRLHGAPRLGTAEASFGGIRIIRSTRGQVGTSD